MLPCCRQRQQLVRVGSYNSAYAAVMEPVDMMASKAIVPLGTCGFESHPPHLTRPSTDRQLVLFLAGEGLNPSQIARSSRIPRSTVRDWLGPAPPGIKRKAALDLASLPETEDAYLLGF